jgi:AraC-like DNA-binding protein
LELYASGRPIGPEGIALSELLVRSGAGRWEERGTRAAVDLILLELLNRLDDEPYSPAGKAYSTWMAVREYILGHCREPITRESVAQAVGITATHVSRLFARFGNEGFGSYVERLRIGRAQSMLRSSRLSVKQVAAGCGFGSDNYFVRVFRQWNGVSPGRWRAGVR